MRGKTVVVGGGIAGLISAKYLVEKGHSVELIEATNQWGGLLGVAHQWQNHYFDFGTHFLSSTGYEDIDDFLFGPNFQVAKDWLQIPTLNSGNYSFGKLQQESQAPNFRLLAEHSLEKYKNACFDLMNIEAYDSPKDLEQWCLSNYGETITTEFFEPTIRKLFDAPLNKMSLDSQRLFGINRLILGSEHFLNEVKKSPFFDHILSYDNRSSGASRLKVFYPERGVGGWVEKIVEQLSNSPLCNLSLNTKVTSISRSGQSSWNLVKENGDKEESIEASKLYWCSPTPILATMLSVSAPIKPENPMRLIDLYHFVFDEINDTDLSFFYCYDPNVSPLRVTIYPKLNEQAGQSVTVEVLRNRNEESQTIEQVKSALETMSVISPSHQVTYQCHQPLPTGFPVLTNLNCQAMQALNEVISKAAPDIQLFGRAPGNQFFMKDVLINIYRKLEKIVD